MHGIGQPGTQECRVGSLSHCKLPAPQHPPLLALSTPKGASSWPGDLPALFPFLPCPSHWLYGSPPSLQQGPLPSCLWTHKKLLWSQSIGCLFNEGDAGLQNGAFGLGRGQSRPPQTALLFQIKLHQQISAFYEDIYDSLKKPYGEGMGREGSREKRAGPEFSESTAQISVLSAIFLSLHWSLQVHQWCWVPETSSARCEHTDSPRCRTHTNSHSPPSPFGLLCSSAFPTSDHPAGSCPPPLAHISIIPSLGTPWPRPLAQCS